MSLVLSEIWVHPVKSFAGHRVEQAEVDDRGLALDRRFMVVDESGRFLTQREHPEMARFSARWEDGALQLAHEEEALTLAPTEAGPRRPVTVWDDEVEAVDQGDDVATWLRDRLEQSVRLVFMPASSRRAADPRYARAGDLNSFADGFPFLLLGQASLDDFRGRVEADVDARRFRPNLVVSGAAPYAEDGWAALRIGALRFEAPVGCSRCVMVDVDPDRGVSDKAVLKTLSGYRTRDRRVWLGVNLVHDAPGALRVGDAIDVVEA
ncbi:MAG: MOSC domain-containing protein [Sandaracinaceae bacterium]